MIEILKFLKKNTILELNFADKNGSTNSVKSTVMDIFDDKLLLCFQRDEIPDTINHSKLHISLCTVEGVLSGNVNFLKKNEDGTIFVSFPYNNMISQRRENSRFPLHFDTELTIGNEQYNLKTKNISGKGLAVLSENSLPDFESAEVKISLPEKDIVSCCRKIYSKEVFANNKTLYLNGIALTTITEENIEYIVKTCTKISLKFQHSEMFADL